MKTLSQYIAESEKTFEYRIKVVGEVPNEFFRVLKERLKKFEPVSMGEIKRTPVLARPTDFPAFPNQAVSMFDVVFRYPAIPPQIFEITKMLGVDSDRVVINELKWQEGMDKELLGIEQQKDLLTTDYPANSAEQRRLKADYAADAHDKAVVKNSASEARWTVAGGRTPRAETTNDLPQGVKSPMTKIKRPPLPATGAKVRG
jgi:hypothetical protein